MTFVRVLHAEALKIRRTIAWKMAFVAPAIIILLAFLAVWLAPYSTINRFGPKQDWVTLTRFCMLLWAILMLPLYVVLQSALLAGLDHAGGQWRSIFARPLPRWTFYAAKLTFTLGLAGSASVLLALGIAIDGTILPHIQREVVFPAPIPWAMILQNCAEALGLAFAGLTIQNWISLRWRSFTVAMAAGIVLLVLGVFAGAVGQAIDSSIRFLPPSLPMLMLARNTENIGIGLAISAICGTLVAIAAGVDFCRREVS